MFFSVIDFLGFPPSIVAAAAVVAAAGESADLPETFYERVNKVILRFVKYILHLVRRKMAFGVHYSVLPVIYTRFYFGKFCRLKQCTFFFSFRYNIVRLLSFTHILCLNRQYAILGVKVKHERNALITKVF